MTELAARGLCLSHGARTVLKGVDFSARAGEVTAIVGPNGSGKSTLLNVLSGNRPDAGQVCLNGREMSRLRPWELAALRGVLPQSSRVAFAFTVAEVVRIGAGAGPAGEDPDLPQKALRRVGLSHLAERVFQELSGGEQQRVMLARVLAQVWEPVQDGAPRWLLLDEPVSSLDIAHQLQVIDIARDFAQSGGGVVAVMHDLNLTALFADRIVVLSDGRILASGSPREVLRDDVLERAYGCALRVSAKPPGDVPYILPQSIGV